MGRCRLASHPKKSAKQICSARRIPKGDLREHRNTRKIWLKYTNFVSVNIIKNRNITEILNNTAAGSIFTDIHRRRRDLIYWSLHFIWEQGPLYRSRINLLCKFSGMTYVYDILNHDVVPLYRGIIFLLYLTPRGLLKTIISIIHHL